MWALRQAPLPDRRGIRLTTTLQEKPATYSEVVAGWQQDAEFRTLFNRALADVSFAAFRWETPPVTTDTYNRSFECVLLNSPSLVRRPTPDVFADQFTRFPEQDVLLFPNLGGDALMVVPQPRTAETAYGHLAAFVRFAPAAQQQQLWQMVGAAMAQRISNKPVWLSTAGGGVSWLHVRLDDRPKYYGFGPYRQRP